MAAANAGRKSTAHLRLVDGRSPGKDSGGRTLPEAPKFERTAPVKPLDMTPDAAEMWDAIVADLGALKLLKPLDGFALRVGCETYSRWIRALRDRIETQNGSVLAKTSQGVGVSPLVRVESEASREFRAWCAEFGLTPAAEGKLVTSLEGGEGGDLF